jgi:hypothetical protein
MPKLTYPEAVKKARATKAPENFLVVHIEARLVVPHKDGVQLLQALANAEKLSNWGSDPPIAPIDNNTIQSHSMSARQYERHKIAALMGVSVRDVEQAEEAAAQAENNPPTP